MISIKRVYLNTGLEVEVLINPRYIIEINQVQDHEVDDNGYDKPPTRIVLDSATKEGPKIMYTIEHISSIKGKITKWRNQE